ncbi:threonine/serine exporter family protein [Fervidibacillus halotolerans]|uniref:Threonine/serine exporter family protein n=1 Tax=Fervidibacillus halotolerans TaxID=2980027 RepID=A0A9E8RZ20_9BACI|nr:threonine/serine exporter family protein [Fervidibacillus halotolerans]WAA12734.1 threonine/serine exporter family protein [Fervidibacillus halotolerans]
MTKSMTMQEIEIREVCLLAGKIMLESGAETYRVEDTMVRIATSYGVESAESYVTPTAIIFTIEGEHPTKTKMIRIMNRGTDLNKIAMVNNISREIHSGKWSVREAYQLLKEIEKSNVSYPIWIQILAATIASACFVIMFNGRWDDFLPAFFAGGIGYSWFLYIDRFVHIRFFSEFSASLFIALSAVGFVYFGFGVEIDKIVIGSVMPLVPGLLITNAIRDLMAGHLVSGLTKGAEAVLTAFAIGSGVAVILVLFS